jgi:hypothetical protein
MAIPQNLNMDPGVGIGAMPLLGFMNNDQIMQRDMMQQQRRTYMSPGEQSEPVKAIVSHVRKAFSTARDHRESEVESRLTDALYRRVGQYPPEKLGYIRKTGGTEVFIKITEVKCNAAEAWISDIFAPTDGKPWTIEHTPIPELSPAQKSQADMMIQQQIMMQVQATGQMPDQNQMQQLQQQFYDVIQRNLNEDAKQRARRMETLIDDQFREGGMMEAFDEGLNDLVTLGTMVIKGPYSVMKRGLTWDQNGSVVVDTKPVDCFSWVNLWDCFPAPNSTDCQDGDYFIERMQFNRRDIAAMVGMEGFIQESVEACLKNYSKGRPEYVSVDSVVGQLAEQPDTVGTNHEDSRIHALIYWGDIMGHDLAELNITEMPDGNVVDPSQSYQVEAWVIGSYCIRVAFNSDPLGKRPYSKTVYKHIPGSFFGRGIPELMSDIQDACNATARAMINNMGISSGPQVMITDINRIAEGEDITAMYPWKIWQFTNDGMSQNAPIQFFSPNSNTGELMTIFGQFMSMADDRTVPAYSYGSDRVGGAGATASGLSMLMTSAARTIKRVIALMDKFIFKDVIHRQFVRNMIQHPETSTKGDVKITVSGALGMFVKEQQLLRMNDFMQLAISPIYSQLLGPEKLMDMLREHSRQLQLPASLVPSKEEFQEKMLTEQQAALMQQQQQMMQQQQQAMMEQQGAAGGQGAPAMPPVGMAQPQPPVQGMFPGR